MLRTVIKLKFTYSYVIVIPKGFDYVRNFRNIRETFGMHETILIKVDMQFCIDANLIYEVN